ncbi:MAG: LamG-like jellyroll fold domain-containing protein, partial [Alphaproteobacteria bacterium]
MRKLFGYSDQISVRPGEPIKFMVSSLGDQPYRADIVRLVCGDDSPSGPGFKETVVETPISGDYPGRAQAIHDGSYVTVPGGPVLDGIASFTLPALIWPTTPGRGRQALLGKWCDKAQAGFGLYIDDDGAAALRLGDGSGAVEIVSAGVSMVGREWHFVAASFDAATREMRVYQEPLDENPGVGETLVVSHTAAIAGPGRNDAPFLMAAQCEEPGGAAIGAHYNGKMDSPRLASRALDRADMAELVQRPMPASLATVITGWWDFSADISGTRVTDMSVNRLHGETVNLPTRGQRGFNWSGREHCWRHATDEYGA